MVGIECTGDSVRHKGEPRVINVLERVQRTGTSYKRYSVAVHNVEEGEYLSTAPTRFIDTLCTFRANFPIPASRIREMRDELFGSN